MSVRENILILITISPLIYLGVKFLWHMDKMRTKAWDDAIEKAAEEDRKSSEGDNNG